MVYTAARRLACIREVPHERLQHLIGVYLLTVNGLPHQAHARVSLSVPVARRLAVLHLLEQKRPGWSD